MLTMVTIVLSMLHEIVNCSFKNPIVVVKSFSVVAFLALSSRYSHKQESVNVKPG